jgi:uncharacterized membrane protein
MASRNCHGHDCLAKIVLRCPVRCDSCDLRSAPLRSIRVEVLRCLERIRDRSGHRPRLRLSERLWTMCNLELQVLISFPPAVAGRARRTHSNRAPRYGASSMREWIEATSLGIEVLAVLVIASSIMFGSVRFLLQLSRQASDPFRPYKELIGRSLLLALEFLVAADVIRTVALDLTPRSVGMLAALVAIRTFLSWSVEVEIDGHWPWESAAVAARVSQ